MSELLTGFERISIDPETRQTVLIQRVHRFPSTQLIMRDLET